MNTLLPVKKLDLPKFTGCRIKSSLTAHANLSKLGSMI